MNTIRQQDLTGIYRQLHLIQHTFFLGSDRKFLSTDHFWAIKHIVANLKQLGYTEYTLGTPAIKLEISNRKQLKRSRNVLKLNNEALARKLVKGDVSREMFKYLKQTKVKN